MTNEVQQSYDAMAELYASLFLREIDRDENALGWLSTFADLAAARPGTVADLGCGPGYVVHRLGALGLDAVGYDVSPGQIDEARSAFPESTFNVGDLAALDVADSSLAGIVARYSLIHMRPDHLGDVFAEWHRVLTAGAPVLVSFFGSQSAEDHATPFDHAVVTAYELWPPTVADLLRDAGFVIVRTHTLPPPKDGRPFTQATVLAQMPDS